MGRAMTIAFGCLILFSMFYIGWVAYRVGFWDGGLEAPVVKDPVRFPLFRRFYTVKLETEPETWCTIEDLGIVLIRDEDFDRYYAYVVNEHEERALAGMMQPLSSFESPVVKYEDEFYRFGVSHRDYGFYEGILSLAVIPLLILAAVWGIFAIIAFLSRTRQTCARTI